MRSGIQTVQEGTSGRFLAENAERYLAKVFGVDDLKVKDAGQFSGGISRQNWYVDTIWHTPEGKPVERSVVVKLDPPSSLLESRRQVEYSMLKAFWLVPGVPVPQTLFIEDDPEPLGMACFGMERLDGVTRQNAILEPAFKATGPRIARQAFEILGRIAAADYRNLELEGVVDVPAPEVAWVPQLDYWEQIIRDFGLGPLPVTSAVIRRLRREPPPPLPHLAIVQGDYHFGNWLYTPEGIVAVLDWEMAHLGDPHEDLAWALARNWRSGSQPNKIMEFLEPEEAIRVWEKARGEKVDYGALQWWTLFTHIKANAIWSKAAYEVATSNNAPIVYAVTAWKAIERQEVWMLEDMGISDNET
jgi:aminoglycoside phosphotransferase (APT) family kinase protein